MSVCPNPKIGMRSCMMKRTLFLLLTCGIVSNAYATDLYTVYLQALKCDPVLAQAEATRNSVQEGVPQSRAALLPTLSSSANVTDLRNSEQNGSNNGNALSSSGISGNQHSYTLSLSQSLFNFQNWMLLRAAKNTAKQADATYNAALQDLIIRVNTAYFNVLQAQDNLRFIKANKNAVGDQLKQIKERYQVGMATMTDVYQAQANYDSLDAQEIAAQNTVKNNFEALRQITGQSYQQLDPLRAGFALIRPQPDNSEQWIRAGENNNWTLLAARYAEQAAKENIRVNYAGHFPTLDATGQYQNGNGPAVGVNTNSNAWASSVGLEVKLPLYQGGLVMSKTRQAQDDYLAASDKMIAAHRLVVFQAQQAFNNVMAGISKVKADRIAITSAQSALDSIQAGYQAGTKTILDVLTAQQNLYQAESNLSTDQNTYILSTLALKQAAGSLNASDVLAVNRWLVHG